MNHIGCHGDVSGDVTDNVTGVTDNVTGVTEMSPMTTFNIITKSISQSA